MADPCCEKEAAQRVTTQNILSCRVWLFDGAAVSAFFALVLVIVSVVSALLPHSPSSP